MTRYLTANGLNLGALLGIGQAERHLAARDHGARIGEILEDVVVGPLAAGILAWQGIVLSPAVGAVLMSVSTIIVAINAQLLRRVRL